MELSDLKSIWKKTTTAQGEGYFVSYEQIQALIKKKSNTAVSEIKRGIFQKIFMAGSVSLICLSVAVLGMLSDSPIFLEGDFISNQDAFMLYLILGIVVGFISLYNAISYRRILSIEKKEVPLKESLQSILAVLQSAIKVKIYSDTFGSPAAFVSIVIAGLVTGEGLFSNPQVLIFSLLAAIGFGTFAHFMSKRTQKKRYGKQIDSLEECLVELEEN